MTPAIGEPPVQRKGVRPAHRETLRSFIVAAGEQRRRGMLQFAEEEIVLNDDGPYPGRFRGDRQPFAKLLFAEIDSGRWTHINVVGCVQSGKTTICYVIPMLYHLFELREKCICGIPDLKLAGEKWVSILKPAIERTRFRAFLPDRGDGSRDGDRVQTVRFKNRATLRFMSGQGGDTQRSSETTRVMLITEVDKMDHISSVSEEGSKIDQFIDRTKAWDDKALVYKECTPSTSEGRIWQDYMLGSQSRIALCCWHCEQWIVPTDTDADTDLLTGWKDAVDEIEAQERGTFACPLCKKAWSESERKEMNLAAVLLHKGQTIEKMSDGGCRMSDVNSVHPTSHIPHPTSAIPGSDDVIVGPMPRTRTLGFRFSAVNNFIRTAGNLAAEEWNYAHAADEESASRTRLQKMWALPHKPDVTALTPLTVEWVQRRTGLWGRGTVPPRTVCVSGGVDLGKWRSFYVHIAWYRGEEPSPMLFGHIFEYGVMDVPTIHLGVEQATLVMLREYRDRCALGWADETGKVHRPAQVWIDTGYAESRNVARQFIRETRDQLKADLFRPLYGRGETADTGRRYTRPSRTGNLVKFVGEGYHVSWDQADHVNVVEVNVDFWKTWLHQHLTMPAGEPGAVSMYAAIRAEHLTFAKHLAAERPVQMFDAARGLVTRWERVDKSSNHYLDAACYGCAAGHLAQLAALRQAQGPPNVGASAEVETEERGFRTPDGREIYGGMRE